jgi:sodium transport system permease protein
MKTIWTIFKKEMIDTLRDRRTLLTMIVIPLVLIPVLLSVTTNITSSQISDERDKDLRIAIESEGGGTELIRQLDRRGDFRIYQDIPFAEFKKLIRSDSLDLAILIKEGFDAALTEGQTGKLAVFYNSTSDIPFNRLQGAIDKYHQSILKERLDSIGATFATITPTEIEQVDVFTQRESIGKNIGGFMPYIFVLFCLIGAMYPSIDLFTGEKERGTLETILTVPAQRIHILLGKMLTVVLAGVISGGLSILGLFLALQLNTEVPESFRNVILQMLNPTAVTLIILMLIPLATFFSGILIPASIYARSFKEAQTLIQPMLIAAILPLAIIATLPTLSLNPISAVIPIINVALASKEIIAGTIQPGLLILVFVSLIAVAGIGIALCVRWFGKEGNILRV